MMKKIFWWVCCIILFGSLTFSQQQNRYYQQQNTYVHNFGLGIVFGEPTGFAWKYHINSVNAVDGVIGFTPVNRFRAHVDYLWQSHPFNEQNLSLHYGPGMAFGDGRTNNIGFGLRGVAGLTYLVKNTPLDIFFEVAPVMIFSPDPGSAIDAGFGGRFYF